MSKKVILTLLSVFIVLQIVIGIYWSQEPPLFNVNAQANDKAFANNHKRVTGYITTSTLIDVVDIMLHKPGGYLSNDVTPPSVLLDNIPNWEYGVIVQIRDLARALRNNFSRSQSQSAADKDLEIAEPLLHFDSSSWIFPSTEGEYETAIKHLDNYLIRLADPAQQNAQFYARADNLGQWLRLVETRLGDLSQRLSASVASKRINTDLAGDNSAEQSTETPQEVQVQTPWLEIDNVFYEARGSTWALIHLLKAVEIDFARVLEDKNARVSLQQIIRELEATQRTIWSPIILNGGGFGMFANHSLVMASYVSRANAAIIDLRSLLEQG